MSFTSPVIVLDIDGVLADFVTRLCLEINSKAGTSLSQNDITSFDWINTLPIDRAILQVCYEQLNFPAGLISLPAYPEARVAIESLSQYFCVFCATSRPFESDFVTRRWVLDQFGLAIKGVFLSNDEGEKRNLHKADVVKQVSAVAFVDDDPGELKKIDGATVPYLVKRPWNKNNTNYLPSSLPEIVGELIEVFARP